MPKTPKETKFSLAYWNEIIEVRVAVSKALEKLRVAGGIGSSLDAEVELYCGAEIFEKLSALEDELRFALITSHAKVMRETEKSADLEHIILKSGDEIWINVYASPYEKCVRCWHHREEVGNNETHPQLCGRCIDNVDGNGEQRRFV